MAVTYHGGNMMTRTNWATLSDFQEAIQNPRLCFDDPELRRAIPITDALGLPRPITGNFASVYQMRVDNKSYAVRCFLRPQPDRVQRYAAISDYLRANPLPYTVEFHLIENGIRVKGTWYPILKMAWLEGDTLITFIEKNLQNPHRLEALAHEFKQMTLNLQKQEIAHGDLQHGNIIMHNGHLRLIDYDGMYVPSLRGKPSEEVGHRNYQHPRRSGYDFGPHIDNFSAWVIYLSLMALSHEPRLWKELSAGDEALLFKGEDFENAYRSEKLRRLSRINASEFQRAFIQFQGFLNQPIAQIPALNGDLPANIPIVKKPRKPGASWLDDHVRFGDEDTPDDPMVVPMVADDPPPPADAVRLMPLPPTSTPRAGKKVAWVYDYLSPPTPPDPIPIPPLAPTPQIAPSPALTAPTQVTSATRHIPMTSIPAAMAPEFDEDDLQGKRIVAYSGVFPIAAALLVMGGFAPWIVAAVAVGLTLAGNGVYFYARYWRLPETRAKFKLMRNLRLNQVQIRNAKRTVQDTKALIATLDDREKSEIAQIQQVSEAKYIRDQLRAITIESARLVGIGQGIKARLAAENILTAADLEPARLAMVKGVGEKRIDQLLKWREQQERLVRANMQTSFQQMQTLELDRIRQYYISARAPLKLRLAQAEQELRTAQQTRTDYRNALHTYRYITFYHFMVGVILAP